MGHVEKLKRVCGGNSQKDLWSKTENQCIKFPFPRLKGKGFRDNVKTSTIKENEDLHCNFL